MDQYFQKLQKHLDQYQFIIHRIKKRHNPSYVSTTFHICLTGKTFQLNRHRTYCKNHENCIAIQI